MQDLTRILRERLGNASRVAVLGIGSDIRGDDAAGIEAVREVKKIIRGKKTEPKVRLFIGGTAPENLTGEIKRFEPTHLVIIDSAYSKVLPGQITILDAEQIDEVSFFTHKLPIKVMVDYLRNFIKCRVIIIGIQPKDITINGRISKEVSLAIKKLSESIAKILNA